MATVYYPVSIVQIPRNSVETSPAASRTDAASPHAFPSATREAVCERRKIALYFAYREHRIFHPSHGRIERFRELTGH
jgi:hypothetical protein